MNKRTVLIVDDQSINRRILEKLLREEYHVLQAENGQEALDILRARPEEISAVVLDIVMPVMDGYGVLNAMREDATLCKIPVIVSSQKDGDEAEVHALELGAQDFIAKPYKGDIIRHRLNNTIRLRENAAIINRVEKDELTGLYNKQFFLERVREILAQHPREAYDIGCLGVERFKLINDTFGVAKGDELLRHVASVLQKAKSPLASARFSADMFYFLIPHGSVEGNPAFPAMLREMCDFPLELDVELNCGVYVISDKTMPVIGMCDRAKLAAEKNKENYGTPCSYYDDSIRQKLLDEQFVIGNVRTALEEHQFQVYYQPKYDLTTECVAGAEALIRWIHPERGFLSPGMFVPVLEQNGLISQLDEYVWESACRDLRSWMDAGLPAVAVSVNVSRADIYNPNLPELLLGLIAKYNIPIRYLHLEITESAYTSNPDQIIAAVKHLRLLGFLIEMDDFGSGYSSLNMLAEMPVDVLKLDMGFVQHESKNPSGKGIISFVISLAKWLDLSVVAEGVETADQISMLRAMDCNYVQGFYYARPMKRTDFENLIRNNKTVPMVCHSDEHKKQAPIVEGDDLTSDEGVMLIVDDIELNRAVLGSTFSDEYRIVEAADGAEAWDYLQKHGDDVQVIMLDLLMPVMDGFQVLGKIRSDLKLRNVPVIITSQGDARSEQRALAMTADDFISKPYSPEIVRHRVHNVVESKRLHALMDENRMLRAAAVQGAGASESSLTAEQKALLTIEALKPHFDMVRLVDAESALVYSTTEDGNNVCGSETCFSVWGKNTRCNNCISMRALREKGNACKLEYSNMGLFFVKSEYVPYGAHGGVIEMVTRLEDEYVDNVFDKDMLYLTLDGINAELETDPLTGVFNRRFLDSHLKKYVELAQRSGKELGLAMVDIDNFKALNDTYGHLCGDRAVKAIARVLADNIAHSKGDFVARFGGDEFVVVCRNIPLEVFEQRIEAVSRLAGHVTLGEPGTPEATAKVQFSAGCVSTGQFPQAGVEELIAEADRRLYLDKAKHRAAHKMPRAPQE